MDMATSLFSESTVPFDIPVEALDTDIAVLGRKGKGKTYAAKGIVERLLEMKRRVLVLDVLGIWWGLKSSADGQSEGFPVAVFGGDHADVPLSEQGGRKLAKLLAHENIPAVIDMGLMRKAQQQRLVADLLDELFIENRAPLSLVLEEADAFAPQTPMGDSTRVLGEVDRIARRGRSYGFRLISITQRPAKLHKDVLTQLSTLCCLGVSSPNDREAIKAWVEGNGDREMAKEVYRTLSHLRVGEGWVWSPDYDILQRVQFPPIKTLDTSATPKDGEKRIEPRKLAQADIASLADALGADEPEQDSAGPPPEQLRQARETAYNTGFKAGEEAGFQRAVREVRAFVDKMGGDEPAPAAPPPAKPVESRAARPARDDGPGELNAAAKGFLEVAREVHPIRMTWGQLAALRGRKARGGAFNTAKKTLLAGGYLVERDGLVEVGEQWRPEEEEDVDLVRLFVERLPRPASDILELVAEQGPLRTEDIAERLGRAPRGGSWNTAMALLRQNELLRETARGYEVALSR